MRGNSGYTLMELLVAVAVAAILAMVAIPKFNYSMRNNRGVSDANSIVSILTLARSEAIKRDVTVSVCATTDGTSCITTGTAWENGMLVFVDYNGNGVYESGGTADVLIRADVPLSRSSSVGYTNASGTALTSLSFRGLGQLLTSTAAGKFTVLPTQKAGKTVGRRYVEVLPIGRAIACDPTPVGSKCT